jgi:hypothetical protein
MTCKPFSPPKAGRDKDRTRNETPTRKILIATTEPATPSRQKKPPDQSREANRYLSSTRTSTGTP